VSLDTTITLPAESTLVITETVRPPRPDHTDLPARAAETSTAIVSLDTTITLPAESTLVITETVRPPRPTPTDLATPAGNGDETATDKTQSSTASVMTAGPVRTDGPHCHHPLQANMTSLI
jgi:hypothetical protein